MTTFTLNIKTEPQQREAVRAEQLRKLAHVRWQRGCEGVSLESGASFPGDENTRSTLAGAVQALQQGMISAPVAWKTPTGFVELSEDELVAAAAAATAAASSPGAAAASARTRSRPH